MTCTWCAGKKGYELKNYHGKIGSYYDNKCKHCGHSFCSIIMYECNASKDGRKYDERSNDGNAYVYSEDFVRRVMREHRV